MNNEKKITVGKVLLALLKAGCYLLLFLGCQLLVSLVVTLSLSIFLMSDSTLSHAQYLLLMEEKVMALTSPISLISGVLTLVILALFFLIRRKKICAEVGLVKAKPRMVAAAVSVVPAFYVIIILILNLLPEAWLADYSEASSALNDTGVWTFLATVIVAPLVEEVTFRGLIMSRLHRVMPGWLAAVLTALIFGLCHGQAVWIAYATVLGLFFCWLALRSGSILPSLAAHVLFNAIGHFSVYFENAADWTFLVFAAALVAVSVVCCLLTRRGLSDYFRRPAPIVEETPDHE